MRYIGKSNNPQLRYSRHLSNAKHKHTHHAANWIRKLVSENKKPFLKVIEKCKIKDWKERECYWINKYTLEGAELTNCRGGGDGADFVSAETRQKMREKKLGTSFHAGFKNSEQSKSKMSNSAKNRFNRMSKKERLEYMKGALMAKPEITQHTKDILSRMAKERLCLPQYKKQQQDAQKLAAEAAKNRIITDKERELKSLKAKLRYKGMTHEQRLDLNLRISNGRQKGKKSTV